MYQADVFVQQGCRVKRILRIENKNCIIFYEDEIFFKTMKKWRNREFK